MGRNNIKVEEWGREANSVAHFKHEDGKDKVSEA